MDKLTRSSFLKMGASLVVTPALMGGWTSALANHGQPDTKDEQLMKQLVAANDNQVKQLMDTVREGNLSFSRKTAYDIAVFSASYCYPDSAYYRAPGVRYKIDLLVRFLASAQTEDGTVNVGNLESPPDTAFVMEILCAAAEILKKDNFSDMRPVQEELKKIIEKAGNALSTGGVHTPNHRWVVSAALSQMNSLYPRKSYMDRIEDWLGEGIYVDADGHFPERSGTYSGVEVTAFITLARKLNRPELLGPVRKNLSMMYYYMEENGDFVSNDSRRQDQYAARRITSFYLPYRYMAIHDKSNFFAAIVKKIESSPGFDRDLLRSSLFYFLDNEKLQLELPPPASLPDEFEKFFTTSQLVRIKRQSRTITLFGGVDWPLIIASGRSNSPDFFSYRKGEAILKYMRMSTAFFSTGYFYSRGIERKKNGYMLHNKVEVPYYQPLPKEKRRKDGDYELSPSIDGRFWNKMDFKNRPVSNVKTLDTRITFTEDRGEAALLIEVDGLKDVGVTIELCFKEGGELAGVTTDEKGNFFLEKDEGVYTFGNDAIHFGPGSEAFRSISNLEGERYSTHFGSLRTEGMHVYITGVTPFRHVLKFN